MKTFDESVTEQQLVGLILAAGLSSRMGGKAKALKLLGGSAMLAHSIKALRAAGLPSVRVVTGHEADLVSERVLSLGAKPVYNPVYKHGMFSSLCTGLDDILLPAPEANALGGEGAEPPCRVTRTPLRLYLGDECDFPSILLLPVDGALVLPGTVRHLLRAWEYLGHSIGHTARQSSVIIPAFEGKTGHPPLLGGAHIPGILLWQGDGQWQDQWQWRGGLRNYLARFLEEEDSRRFMKGAAPPQCCAHMIPGHHRPPKKDGFVGRQDEALAKEIRLRFPLYKAPVHDPRVSFYFLPLPDSGLLADLDSPKELATAEKFMTSTRQRKIPSAIEALEWLRISGLSRDKTLHSLHVALGAVRLATAMQARGYEADVELCLSGGLMHDTSRDCLVLPRKCKDHARKAAEIIADYGWIETALVVGSHTVLPDPLLNYLGIALRDVPVACPLHGQCVSFDSASETLRFPLWDGDVVYGEISSATLFACACVYLADKYFFMDQHVSISTRYGMVKERFSGDDAALSAIGRREAVGFAVEAQLTGLLGAAPETIVLNPVESQTDIWLRALISTYG